MISFAFLIYKNRKIVLYYFPTKYPITIPPITPTPIIGMYVLVIMASGRLKSNPIIKPFNHGSTGRLVLGIRKPIAKRPIKEPNIAIALSFIGRGTIKSTSRIPKTNPAIKPLIKLLIKNFSKNFITTRSNYISYEDKIQLSTTYWVWNTFRLENKTRKIATKLLSLEYTFCDPKGSSFEPGYP